MPFQSVINNQQAPAVQGDFASTNPFASVLAGQGALVAPAGGLIVGNFFWVGPTGQCSQSYVAGYQIAFLGRNEQALITAFLGETSLVVPAGFMITGFNEGDFWAKFPNGATVGQNVYADPNDGTPLAGATAPGLASGTATGGFTGTATVVAASTTLTVASATSGILSPGDTVTLTGVPANTTIVQQLTGTPGKVGTYQMSVAATTTEASAEAITGSSSLILVGTVTQAGFTAGDSVTGTGVGAGTTLTGQATPFSGVATLATNTTLVITSVQPNTDLLRVGATVVAAGIPSGTTIIAQTAGTPGGIGTYTLSAASTVTGAGIPITTADSAGGTGLYSANITQEFTSATITAAGTAQTTPFKVRGTYSPLANELGIISTN
jgi:hypothetical protein